MIEISNSNQPIVGDLNITGSKSESNRWLILQAIFNGLLSIQNLSNSKDTQVLQQALSSNDSKINIGHAGTAMRFLTAYFAIQPGREVLLTGSDRMQERPIKPLVDALLSMGAAISYVKNEGYPPLLIKGKEITQDFVNIQADVSSQYITALMLIAPSLPNGLTIYFKGELTSKPYVEMTKSQLEILGISVDWVQNGIQIQPYSIEKEMEVFVESDWSSASYWYSMVALNPNSKMNLGIFKANSLQGDARLAQIYEHYFGVQTIFSQDTIQLTNHPHFSQPDYIKLDLNHAPDIAQTIIVTCAGLGVKAKLTGLKTLKVKETDRLLALQNELKKIGVLTTIDDESIEIVAFNAFDAIPVIETYQDHRMAMSFAPLAQKYPIQIKEEQVVAKSYPSFWEDLDKLGFQIKHL